MKENRTFEAALVAVFLSIGFGQYLVAFADYLPHNFMTAVTMAGY